MTDDHTLDGTDPDGAEVGRAPSDGILDAPDAALAHAMADDEHAAFDLDTLAEEVGATRALLDAVERAGLLLPHHVDDAGTARYSPADAEAVRAGLTLLEAGLPLGELLDLARHTDEAVGAIAGPAVDAFLRFVRDPVRGTSGSDDEAAERLVTAYQRMLPATERLVAHHLRRRLLAVAAERLAAELTEGSHGADGSGTDGADGSGAGGADE
jgi:DNA-binding transcriptional MerR regulator